MAINVKRLKRVIQGDEPLKVLNSGDKKPAFRQNGYGLTFDAANSDFLEVEKVTNWVNLSDIDFSVKFDSPEAISETRAIFVVGGFGSATSGLVRVVMRPFTFYSANVYITGTSNSNPTSFNYDLDMSGSYEIGIKGLDLIVNGVSVHTFADQAVNIDDSLFNPVLGYAGYNETFYSDFSYYNFGINNENFNLTESRGTTTTGSLGNTATINTSNAGGVQYLDSTVWNKKSFALAFDAVNSEFLLMNNTTQINEVSEVSFSVDADFDLSVLSGKQLFSVGKVDSGRGLISLWINSADVVQLDVFDINDTIITKFGGLVDGSESYVFDGVKLYQNGIEIIDLTSEGAININIPITELVTLGRLSYSESRFVNGSIKSFSYLTETFNLTEGLGNQVYGSSGTIATINTVNAQGIERINYGIWLKNGNVLKFDTVNRDYLRIDTPISNQTAISDFTFDINVFIDFITLGQVFAVGSLAGTGNGYIGMYVNTNGRLYYQVKQGEILHANLNIALSGNKLYNIKCDGTSLFIDGVNVLTYADNSIIITIDSVPNIYLGRQSYDSASRHANHTYIDFEFEGEHFNLTEGQGITTTGSLGNTATINTANAGGVQYINEQVWNIDSNKFIDYE